MIDDLNESHRLYTISAILMTPSDLAKLPLNWCAWYIHILPSAIIISLLACVKQEGKLQQFWAILLLI